MTIWIGAFGPRQGPSRKPAEDIRYRTVRAKSDERSDNLNVSSSVTFSLIIVWSAGTLSRKYI
jgi:hypothetical protein